MCRTLIHERAASFGWLRATPPELAYLSAPVRDASDLMLGIKPGQGGAGKGLTATYARRRSTLLTRLAPGSGMTGLWPHYRDLGSYGRLVLVAGPGSIEVRLAKTVRTLSGGDQCQECGTLCLGWLGHPHPGRVIVGPFVEVFGPPEAADLCACVLDDMADGDEAVAGFRRIVEQLIGEMISQSPVLYLDKDAFYAEPEANFFATVLALLT